VKSGSDSKEFRKEGPKNSDPRKIGFSAPDFTKSIESSFSMVLEKTWEML
jgi:hypothetical protein